MKRARIAIVRLSALGDIIVSASVLGGLKRLCSERGVECEIEWFIDERFSAILQNSPCIAKLHALPFKSLLKSPHGILEIYRYCKNCGKYDAVIDMQGLIKSALVGRFLDSKEFVGFSARGAREWLASVFYTRKIDIDYKENILVRNLGVLCAGMGVEIPHLEQILAFSHEAFSCDKGALSREVIKIDFAQSYNVLFILEASIREKIYPVAQYAILAKLLADFLESRGKKAGFYFAWNDSEDSANALLAALNAQNLNATKLPRLDFNALKYVIAKMDCAIGGDTGLTHLSWALGIGCITLYGNASTTSGKNMRETSIERVLLGNPHIVSSSNTFEIASIAPSEVLRVFIDEIYRDSAH